MVHAIFTPQGIVNYRPVMEARAEELVKSIKRAPDAFRGHIHQ
jgi:cytochrome P450